MNAWSVRRNKSEESASHLGVSRDDSGACWASVSLNWIVPKRRG